MRALHWDGQQLAFRTSSPEPHRNAASALIQVQFAGICSTDLQIFRGYMGFQGIPGHEFVGKVIEGPQSLLHKRVVGEINFGCEQCPQCLQGLQRHCQTRQVMGILQADGCFAEYVAIPTRNLHHVPDTVSDTQAVFAEPLAAAYEVLEQTHIKPNDSVLIVGDGKLGLLCAQVLATTGAGVTVVGKYSDKLMLAQGWGLRTSLLSDWTPRQVDVVVEATGSVAGLAFAMDAVRPRGTLILKSTVAEAHTLSLAPLVIHEITVLGSRCGRFAPALRALEQQRVFVEPLIDATYPLRDAITAVSHAARPGARKVLLKMYED